MAEVVLISSDLPEGFFASQAAEVEIPEAAISQAADLVALLAERLRDRGAFRFHWEDPLSKLERYGASGFSDGFAQFVQCDPPRPLVLLPDLTLRDFTFSPDQKVLVREERIEARRSFFVFPAVLARMVHVDDPVQFAVLSRLWEDRFESLQLRVRRLLLLAHQLFPLLDRLECLRAEREDRCGKEETKIRLATEKIDQCNKELAAEQQQLLLASQLVARTQLEKRIHQLEEQLSQAREAASRHTLARKKREALPAGELLPTVETLVLSMNELAFPGLATGLRDLKQRYALGSPESAAQPREPDVAQAKYLSHQLLEANRHSFRVVSHAEVRTPATIVVPVPKHGKKTTFGRDFLLIAGGGTAAWAAFLIAAYLLGNVLVSDRPSKSADGYRSTVAKKKSTRVERAAQPATDLDLTWLNPMRVINQRAITDEKGQVRFEPQALEIPKEEVRLPSRVNPCPGGLISTIGTGANTLYVCFLHAQFADLLRARYKRVLSGFRGERQVVSFDFETDSSQTSFSLPSDAPTPSVELAQTFGVLPDGRLELIYDMQEAWTRSRRPPVTRHQEKPEYSKEDVEVLRKEGLLSEEEATLLLEVQESAGTERVKPTAEKTRRLYQYEFQSERHLWLATVSRWDPRSDDPPVALVRPTKELCFCFLKEGALEHFRTRFPVLRVYMDDGVRTSSVLFDIARGQEAVGFPVNLSVEEGQDGEVLVAGEGPGLSELIYSSVQLPFSRARGVIRPATPDAAPELAQPDRMPWDMVLDSFTYWLLRLSGAEKLEIRSGDFRQITDLGGYNTRCKLPLPDPEEGQQVSFTTRGIRASGETFEIYRGLLPPVASDFHKDLGEDK